MIYVYLVPIWDLLRALKSPAVILSDCGRFLPILSLIDLSLRPLDYIYLILGIFGQSWVIQ